MNVMVGSSTLENGMTLDRKKLRALALGAFMGGAALLTPSAAHAEEVTPTGKGTVGGALLGGEVVVFGEAIFGVERPLFYIIGGGVGVVGGGVGGYFVEKASSDGRVSAYLLAAGIAALIPAIVVTLDATRYKPTEGAREDKPSTDVPPPDPGQPGGSSVVGAPAAAPLPPATPPTSGQTPPAPSGGTTTGGNPAQAKNGKNAPRGSLVGVNQGQLAIGVPVPDVRPILGGTSERAKMGIDNHGSELRFPVLDVTF